MPKRVVTEQWMCFDGVPKPTEAEANAYERRLAHIRMVGLKIEQIEAALTREDLDMADAIEEVARRIKKVRLANGARDPAAQVEGGTVDGGDETRADEAAA